ncbi:MAG TPA: DUF6089 family protein [Ferruginibacter sp.]|jgi:hypothetical protein|nr:DUF6089 family protein [Ferruginibacter sp.]
MRRTIIALLLCLSVISLKAQKFSVAYFAGVANYAGDLQSKAYTFDQAQLAGGIGLEYEISEHFLGRADLSVGKVSGADRKSDNPVQRARNLEFTSNIEEFALNLEYDLFSLKRYKVTPYVFAGVGVFHFNPYTSDALGDKVYLQPLGTEGEGIIKYNLTQINIPYGGGLKFAITDNIRLGIEIGYRKLFTDYLDDVSGDYANPATLPAGTLPYAYRGAGPYPATGSKRGNSGADDSYYFTLLTLSFRLVPVRESDFTKMQLQEIQCPANVILY